MTTIPPPERFVVLAAIDPDDLRHVAMVAARFAAGIKGGELHILHVLPLLSSDAATVDEGRARLERAGRLAAEAFSGGTIGHLTMGDPTQNIVQLAARLKADLIVVGTHGRKGVERFVVGSVSERVVRHAACPVLVVREKDYQGDLGPEIEPPCPDCVATQAKTGGMKMWCARHAERHPHGHVMLEIPEPFAMGSSLIRPD